ncbi:MAG: D-alanyl-D-alanine carboxypeptidase, partial [Gammaproteobacteria bacterium]|nr:D-alanyl-D-alanine carboxypeptidase [Gammaproteobacteria bacterium]
MNEIALRSFYRMLSIAVVIAALAPNAAWAVRASLIMSADSGDVLSRHAPQRLNAPASLTKLMTAYVVLEAIEDGTLAPDASIAISKHAAARPPTRLGVQAGQKIDVQTALRALIVRSANDIAVALAEHIAGSEEAFVALMNQRAASLGLTATRFRNASGLPAPDQVTTAYDMALLAQALLKRFPDAQDLLSAKEVTWAKRQLTRSHPLLRSEPVAVLKTGFTCMAGFNLVSIIDRPSARLVSVVLGAATPSLRDARARADLRTAFADPGIRADLDDPNVDRSLNEKMLATQCINGPSPRRYMQASKWSVELSHALKP